MSFFQNLGTRERIFVIMGAVAVFLILLFIVIIDPLMAKSARLDRQIAGAQRQLQDLYVMQRKYQHQKQVLEQINSQLKTDRKVSIFSRLEGIAGETGIRSKILYMKPTVSAPSDAYEEEAVEIKMEGVTLEQLIGYLYRVENAPQFLKIKRLYIKPRNENRQLLTVIFRVSTFTPKDANS